MKELITIKSTNEMLKSINELCMSLLHVRTAIEFTDGIAESIFHGVERCIFHTFCFVFLTRSSTTLRS